MRNVTLTKYQQLVRKHSTCNLVGELVPRAVQPERLKLSASAVDTNLRYGAGPSYIGPPAGGGPRWGTRWGSDAGL